MGVAELQQQLRAKEEELQSLRDAHEEKTKVMQDAHSEAQQHKSKRLEAKNEIIVVSKTLQVGHVIEIQISLLSSDTRGYFIDL